MSNCGENMKSNKQTWKFTEQEIKLIYVALLTVDPQVYDAWQHIGINNQNAQEILKSLRERLGFAANH